MSLHTTSATREERGAATLLLVLGLVLLATLASAWSSRAVLMDLRTSQTRGQAQQARNAAQAALATAQADVLRAFAQPGAEDLFADKTMSLACPADLQGPRWQCARLPMAAGAEMGGWQLGAIAARDLVASPHVWQLRASSRATSGHGQAFVRESVFAPVMAPAPAKTPGGGTLVNPAPSVNRPLCPRTTWRSVFGDMTATQLKAWSDAQARNGLHSLSQPARSVYWIDSPVDWTQSLGTPQAPVLLVFSSQACAVRCPRIAPGVQIHGTVFVDADCKDDKLQGWQAGTIDGLLAIEGGLTALTGNSLVRARPYARQAFRLHWPEGMDPSQLQRVAGSHREGPP